jgi:NAD(P)H-dependent FMN reductase
MKDSKVLVFAGSTRTDSFHRKLAREAAEVLAGDGASVTFIDLKDFQLPLYDGDTESASGLPENAKRLKQLIREHDSIAIASPEYNGSFPALVKNVVDWVTRPEPGEGHSQVFKGKTVALLSTSPGPGGGRRGLRHLRELFEMIGAIVVPGQVTVAKAFQAFDPTGRLINASDREQLEHVAAELTQAA